MADPQLAPATLDSFVNLGISALVEQLYDPSNLTRLQTVIENGIAKGATVANGAAAEGVLGLAEGGAELFERADKFAQSLIAPFMALLAGHLLGVHVSAEELRHSMDEGEGSPIAKAVVGRVFSALQGPEGGLEPSDAGAQRFLGMLGSLTVQSWFEGILFEHVLSEIPGQEAMEATSELAKDLINSLGLNRLARTALRPLVRATITAPLEWKVNRTYRPTLLGASSALRQFMRGRWSWEDTQEELARAGYSEERINALLNEQRKFFGPGDVRTFVDRGHWTGEQGLQHLRDQGYDEQGALDTIRLEGIKRLDQVESQEANAIVGAYVSRDIDRGEFLAQLDAHVTVATERALFAEIADVRRALNVKHLSSSQAAAAVRAKILAYVDYRDALAREGYTDQAISVLDLLLRGEIEHQVSMDKHRADLAAELALEKQARAAAAAAKRAQVEADAAAKRRGSPASLERAVVRGLIPIARYTEVLGTDYDTDTVQILVDLVEGDRQTYLEQQAKAAAAAKRVAGKGLDVGQLQGAVLENVLTIQQFRAALQTAGFAGTDVDILTATLQARKADADQAKADRAAAAVAAKRKAIDLSQFEQLVRRGIRPIAQYQQLLASLGFDEASQAGLVELLQAKIADDAAAAAARDDADRRKNAGELTIGDFRRAVLLGLKTAAEFDAFLTQQKLTSDKHALLVAELADDVDQAETARRRRAAADASLDARAQQLALVRRAARLGIVTVATYQARLEQAGWTADDIAIETELLLVEIADVQTARAKRDTIERTLQASGLSLAETARAVRAGVLSLDAYQARALAIGVDAGDVAILVRVLGDELTTTTAAKARRAALESTLKPSGTSIAVLEDQVRAGALSIDDYEAQLEQLGLALDDAELLASLVLDELGASGSVAG